MGLLRFAGFALLVLGAVVAVFESGSAGMVMAGVGLLLLVARHVMLNDPDVPRPDFAKIGFRAGQAAASAKRAADDAIAASGLRDDGRPSPSVAAAFVAGYKDAAILEAPVSSPDTNDFKAELDHRSLRAGSDMATLANAVPSSKASYRTLLTDIALLCVAALLVVVIGNGLSAPHWSFVIAHFLEITLIPALIICLLANRWAHIAIAWPLFGVASILLLMTFAGGRPLATGSVFIASGLQLTAAFLLVKSIRWCLNRP